jgi:signal transduction histidine kinase
MADKRGWKFSQQICCARGRHRQRRFGPSISTRHRSIGCPGASLDRFDNGREISKLAKTLDTAIMRQNVKELLATEERGASERPRSAPALQKEPVLQDLAQGVRNEAERLNNDIQNLLDATRISSDGVKPHVEGAEPADILHCGEIFASRFRDRSEGAQRGRTPYGRRTRPRRGSHRSRTDEDVDRFARGTLMTIGLRVAHTVAPQLESDIDE